MIGPILFVGGTAADAIGDERLELGKAAAERTAGLSRRGYGGQQQIDRQGNDQTKAKHVCFLLDDVQGRETMSRPV